MVAGSARSIATQQDLLRGPEIWRAFARPISHAFFYEDREKVRYTGASSPYSLVIPLLLAYLAFLPTAQAVTPLPDGGYPNENTAERTGCALQCYDRIR
nr:hypothetical protein Hi04_10k_c4773_00009 [uncultured bacterium]